MDQPAQAILLATDLSARSDRALARAAQLAAQWNAPLVGVTVAPPDHATAIRDALLPPPHWARTGTPARTAERLLRRSLDDSGLTTAEAIVTHGEPGPALLDIAHRRGCGLIVVGIARNEAFQHLVVGSTVAWLVRHSPIPVLVVHDPARAPYRHLAIASDFSPAAGRALQAAARLFPDALRYTLVHGVEPPSPGLLDTDRARDALETRVLEDVDATATAHLGSLGLPMSVRARLQRVVEPADPVRLLQAWIDTHETDLVVLGSHGRSALSDVLLGSVTRRALDMLDIDTLIVRRTAG